MDIHILPVNDIVLHEEVANCACLPKLSIQEDDVIIVHNSYDGREYLEPDNKKYKKPKN